MFDIFLCIWYNVFMGKDMFTINKNGLSYGRGYVYSLQYHLVWCTKYRKKVLKDGIDVECKEMLEGLAQEYWLVPCSNSSRYNKVFRFIWLVGVVLGTIFLLMIKWG